MSEYDERTEIEKMRRQLLLLDEPYITRNFERIGALEARFEALLDMPPMVVKLGDLRDRIEALEKWLGAAVTDQLTEIEMGCDARFATLEKCPDVLLDCIGHLRASVERLEEYTDQLSRSREVCAQDGADLLERIESLHKRVTTVCSRVSQEVAQQAIAMAGEIANQFAAVRRGEMQELIERVAQLEEWQDAIDVLPVENDMEGRGPYIVSSLEASKNRRNALVPREDDDADEEDSIEAGPGWPEPYENPGPASISPLG